MTTTGRLETGRIPHSAAGLVVVAVVATAAVSLDWRLAVSAAIALPLVAAASFLDRPAVEPSPAATAAEVPRWLAAAWVGSMVLPELRLVEGGRALSAAAQGQASIDIVFEIAVTGLVLVGIAGVLRRGVDLPLSSVAVAASAYPLLALLSASWSRLFLFSLVRGLQFIALAGLAALTAGFALRDPDATRARLEQAFRGLVVVVLALVVLGFLTPAHGDGRFTWPGTHPNQASALLGAAACAIAASDQRRSLARPFPAWIVVGVLLSVQLFAITSRGPLIATAAGLATIVLVRARRDVRVPTLAVALGLVVVTATYLVSSGALVDLLMRGQTVDQVLSLNGRTELWGHVLANPVGSELWGVGVGAARGLLPFSWAGNAHNAWLDTLQTLGALGVGLAAGAVLAVLLQAVRRRSAHAAWMAVFVMVQCVDETAIAEPGALLGLLYLSIPWLYADAADRSPPFTGASLQPGRARSPGAELIGPTRSQR